LVFQILIVFPVSVMQLKAGWYDFFLLLLWLCLGRVWLHVK
jgi:hypothetical protein